MAVPLRILPAPEIEHVPVSLPLLESAVHNAETLADDLSSGLEAAYQRVWAGNRAAALNEIGRLSLRVEAMRDVFTALIESDGPGRIA